MPDIKKYRFYKHPSQLHSNSARLQEMTEEDHKVEVERAKKAREQYKIMFPGVDVGALIFRPENI